MGRKKMSRDPQEELEIVSKLLIDEATNLVKLHNYSKAMSIYQKVNHILTISTCTWNNPVKRNQKESYNFYHHGRFYANHKNLFWSFFWKSFCHIQFSHSNRLPMLLFQIEFSSSRVGSKPIRSKLF